MAERLLFVTGKLAAPALRDTLGRAELPFDYEVAVMKITVAESAPLGRWGTPRDVAAVAVWLASGEAAFLTGQAVNINGGTVM